jgi:hypothetical protein
MKYLTQRAGRAVDAEAHPRLAPDEALQLGAALPAQGTLLHRTGTHYCNIIEAPWLANGGHRASFNHHNDRAPYIVSIRTRIIIRPALQMNEQVAGFQSSLELRPLIYRLGAHLHAAAGHYCNIIKAPWLVHGGHSASLKHHKDHAPPCRGR